MINKNLIGKKVDWLAVALDMSAHGVRRHHRLLLKTWGILKLAEHTVKQNKFQITLE